MEASSIYGSKSFTAGMLVPIHGEDTLVWTLTKNCIFFLVDLLGKALEIEAMKLIGIKWFGMLPSYQNMHLFFGWLFRIGFPLLID